MYHVAEKIQKEVSTKVLGSRKAINMYLFMSSLVFR